jgi:hypothetical protein
LPLQSPRGADGEVRIVRRELGSEDVTGDRAITLRLEDDRVTEVEGREEGVEIVEAVGASAEDLEAEVDLGRGGKLEALGHGAKVRRRISFASGIWMAINCDNSWRCRNAWMF